LTKTPLENLCEKYTDLSAEDLATLAGVAAGLPLFSQLTGVDLFLDCLIKNGQNAVVVAECKPERGRSVIAKSVLGEIVDKSTEPAVLRTLHSGLESINLKSLTVEQRPVYQSAVPIFNSMGKIIGALVSETLQPQDTDWPTELSSSPAGSGLKSAAGSATLPTDTLMALIQPINNAIIIFDQKWRAMHLNKAAADFYKTLGYLGEIEGTHLGNLILDRDLYDEIRREKKDLGREITHGSLTLRIQCVFINHGSETSLALIINDLSELRAKDRELILRSVAMQEIHHRIKNNLQTIASILRLQARRSHDEKTRHALNENISRVLSIAATHEILAQKGLDCLEINALICRIKDSILRYGLPGSKNLKITVTGDAFQVTSGAATTVALVVNELLTNALEHAFVGRDQGEILISITYGSPRACISVEDDGIGFDFSTIRDESLGFGIVRALINDTLGGEMVIAPREKGSKITFTFKNLAF